MTPEELAQIRQTVEDENREYEHHICVCMAAGCASTGSGKVKDALTEEVKKRGLEHTCKVKGTGCLGLCSQGPLMTVEPQGVMYKEVKAEHAPAIIDSLSSKPVSSLLCSTEQPFFKYQKKVVLENCGKIDPENINDYIAHGGYSGLLHILMENSSQDVLDTVFKSGLRGRGGAGYPTGLKWSTVAKAPGEIKYVVCNADEGDPGAFMDRSVLESDPHRVLEGMAIAGFAVGASSGYVYVRAEYPLAIARLRKAIQQAERNGFLGHHICGTPFHFKVEVRLGAGAFVCGEETALIASIEGKRGQPRPRPPYPAERGVSAYPTLINNVETFANIPPIIRNGAEWFASMGTEKSKGTKLFALAGRIENTGLIEVPMGITLRQIVYDMGGGIPGGAAFKAVQTGGPSGGCIPSEFLDTAVDYESLAALGSIMGSGGMIIMDETSSMVDVAKFFMEFCVSESCGKCVPCRVGTEQMYNLLDKISGKKGTQSDLELLENLCDVTRNTSLCGLGQTAPNPVLSTLRYFRSEYTSLLQSNGQVKSGRF
ncbi:MAG: NADH-ubiquinone oxidoreductase-F iron-sulfur binding region domain-containing protein [bacterium]|jgi:bidirectional [NiFe] hydrogenase diaphorase subunit